VTVETERFESTVENLSRLYRAAIAANPQEANTVADNFVKGRYGWHITMREFARIAGEEFPQPTTNERG
jgi:hypothetical protein